MALKLLHTADWHIGKRFPSFDRADQDKLTRARVDVLDKIFEAAQYQAVDAILCAGDLFDEPDPGREWWEPVLRKLKQMRARCQVFLLPGNHDPLVVGSVYSENHPFRNDLPRWVHVVDRDDFTYKLNDVATLYARPCRSRAGQEDLALALPSRAEGDQSIRIGMVHGSTFDYADCQTNFPIAKEAAGKRGFDYLAIGDTHSFRNVPDKARPPVVYPGAPEATAFDEHGAGNVVAVFVTRSRKVDFRAEPVAAWKWMDRVAQSLDDLRALHSEDNLAKSVVRLKVEARLSPIEFEEAERLLGELKGTSSTHPRAGILQLDRTGMVLETKGIDQVLADLPDVLRATVERLQSLEHGDQAEVARAALYHLYRLVRGAEG